MYHGPVQFADVADTDDMVEAQVFVEGFIHLLLGDGESGPGWVLAVDSHQQESLLVGNKREDVDKSGRWGQGSVIAVKHPVETVDGGVKLMEGVKQFYFVKQPFLTEFHRDVTGQPFLTDERDITVAQRLHHLLQPGKQGRVRHNGGFRLAILAGEEQAAIPAV